MERNLSSEKIIERELVKAVKLKKGLCLKLIPDFFNGLPDRLILLPGGKLFFAELKSTGEKPRKLQRIVCDKLINLGFKVYVIDSIQQITNILNEYN